jgi:hypothetical protein
MVECLENIIEHSESTEPSQVRKDTERITALIERRVKGKEFFRKGNTK